MFFKPVIARWAAPDDPDSAVRVLAADLDLPAKNVRRWVDLDTIPADWQAAVVRAAKRRGWRDITEKHLAAIAERRRLTRATDQSGAAA